MLQGVLCMPRITKIQFDLYNKKLAKIAFDMQAFDIQLYSNTSSNLMKNLFTPKSQHKLTVLYL